IPGKFQGNSREIPVTGNSSDILLNVELARTEVTIFSKVSPYCCTVLLRCIVVVANGAASG
ncbi:MAG TPA: hypothetical protein VKU03_03180, partial [Roseiarcus sp.]|nr:hypothetical protein [Roseiarcus sp.]